MPREILILETETPDDLAVYKAAVEAAIAPTEVILRLASSEQDALEHGVHCSAIVAKAHAISARLVANMPDLDWIQALTTGTDHLQKIGVPSTLRVTSLRGIHGPQMSELAIMLMLALSRGLPRMLANQAQARWERRPQPLLQGKTVLIVGIGAISEALALRCAALGMRVTGASGRAGHVAGFDEIAPYSQLGDAAAAADFMVVITPYTAATHHLVNAAVIARMKPTACLINIARGNVVDEAALQQALAANHLAGAGLDVFATEPLPAESPFWSTPNVIVTPHIGGMSDSYAQQAAPIVAANMAVYCTGVGDMLNIVQ